MKPLKNLIILKLLINFGWLFDILGVSFHTQMEWRLKRRRHPDNLRNVDRYTRAGHGGRYIMCPNCHAEALVYHFSWAAITCCTCKKSIRKKDWLVIDWKFT
jgi:hypothetical protein